MWMKMLGMKWSVDENAWDEYAWDEIVNTVEENVSG